MDLGFGPQFDDFRREVRDFLAANWTSPAKDDPERDAKERRFRQLATDQGYFNRNVPRRFGGSEQAPDLVKAEIIREEFARAGAPSAILKGSSSLVIPTLLEWGSEEQCARFIPKTLSGEYVWAQGFSEPGAGSDLASLRTRAELVGDEWVINGQKIWSTGAHKANYMFALVRSEPDAPKHDGISYLLLDLRQPGVTIRPLKQATGLSEFCEVFLDDVRTPAHWIVGERGRGWYVTRSTLKHERSGLGALTWNNSMMRSLVKLAQETPRNGQRAIDDPRIREELAGVEGELMAMVYSTYRTVSMTAHDEEPGLYPLMQKLTSTNLAQRMAKLARDILGDGFLDAEGKDRKWIDRFMISLSMSIAGGASNIQRNIIAERGLGLPRPFAAEER